MKQEKHYIVKWEIDIFATSHVEAAEQALKIQRNPDSIATVFEVKRSGFEKSLQVDLTALKNYTTLNEI